jgi:hypothetical protein
MRPQMCEAWYLMHRVRTRRTYDHICALLSFPSNPALSSVHPELRVRHERREPEHGAESAGTRVFGGARTPTATPVL